MSSGLPGYTLRPCQWNKESKTPRHQFCILRKALQFYHHWSPLRAGQIQTAGPASRTSDSEHWMEAWESPCQVEAHLLVSGAELGGSHCCHYFCLGWGTGSASRMVAVQVWESEFDCYQSWKVSYGNMYCDPNTGTCRHQDARSPLARQCRQVVSSVRDPASENKVGIVREKTPPGLHMCTHKHMQTHVYATHRQKAVSVVAITVILQQRVFFFFLFFNI